MKAHSENRVTIYEIAKRVGCSAMTVSRALMPRKKANDRINPQTCAHIRMLAKEMGYKPNSAARSLILKKTFNVAFHINQTFSYYNPLMLPILRTMQRDLEAAGYHLGFYYFQADDIAELRQFLAPPRRADALVVLGRNLSAEEARVIVESGIPRISIFEKLKDFHSLLIDDLHGGRLVARFLFERGFREVTLVAMRVKVKRWEGRIDGFRSEAKKLGMTITDITDFHDPKYDFLHAWKNGKVAPDLWERLQSMGPAGRCLYCNSDSFAMGLLDYFDSLGVQVGKEISIIGYDNSEELDDRAVSAHSPRLTTISRPRVEIGHHAAQLVINEVPPPTNRTFAPTLVERETVGVPYRKQAKKSP